MQKKHEMVGLHPLEIDRMKKRIIANLSLAFDTTAEIGQPYFDEAMKEMEIIQENCFLKDEKSRNS